MRAALRGCSPPVARRLVGRRGLSGAAEGGGRDPADSRSSTCSWRWRRRRASRAGARRRRRRPAHHRCSASCAAFLPTADVDERLVFELKLIVGVVGPTALGWFLFWRSTRGGERVMMRLPLRRRLRTRRAWPRSSCSSRSTPARRHGAPGTAAARQATRCRCAATPPAGAAAQRQVEARFNALPQPESIRTLASLLHPVAASRHVAANQRDCRVHRRAVEGPGPRRRRHPPLRRAVVESARGVGRDGGAGALSAVAARRSHRRGSGLVAAGDQRRVDVVLGVGRRDGARVYANSGNPADYDLLRAQGIDPRGKIVIVRYSNPYSYRGFKALTAEREGAAAMIVYSDPAEDGYGQGAVYPEGPVGPGQPPAARRHRLRLHRARRSAHAGLGVHARRAAHSARRGDVAAQDHGAADVASRHPADSRAARRARRARRLEGRPAHRLPPGRRDRAAARAHRHADRHSTQLRGGGTHPRQRAARRVGGARQPPRRVGVRRRRPVERHGVDDGADQGARRPEATGRAAEAHAGVRRHGTAKR